MAAEAGEAQAATLTTNGAWWQRFEDEATTDLVERAVRQNYDLQAAAARVLEAEAIMRQVRGARFPSVAATAGASRQQQSLNLPGSFGGGGSGESVRVGILSTNYDVGLAVSWQVDLWGQLRRAQEAAEFDALATEAQRVALAHTIVAQAVRLRVGIATFQRRLELANQNLSSLQETLNVTESRYGAGIGDPLAVRLARTNLAAAEAQIPPLQVQLRLQEHALSVLTGERPGAMTQLPETLPELPPIAATPEVLPAALLDRRPDLLASDLRARAAQARIGVAIADLLPSLRLGAGAGYTGSEVDDLFDPDAQVWNLLAGLVQPVFEGGSRRAAVDAARASAQAATAEYASAILNAIREVEDALVREQMARREVFAAERSLAEASAAEALARDRYSQGLAALLEVFEAERRRRLSEELLALSRQAVWEARIDLHLALGGDWSGNEVASR